MALATWSGGNPFCLVLVMLYGIPRSSRWLVTQNKTDEALEVLKMMGSPDSEAELREIMDSIHLERGMAAEPLFKRQYRLPIFLAITIGFFNQLSGINAILYYSNFIFAAAGFQPTLRCSPNSSDRPYESACDFARHVTHR
jgi:MFS transporter, SP family, arabinose:H+ symporter